MTAPSSNYEKQLARRAAKRDRAAFAELYKLYSDKVYRYIYFKSGRNGHAEDLTSQVFLRALEALPRYRWRGYPFSTWLYRIAFNLLIDSYRTYHNTVPLDLARTRASNSDPAREAEEHVSWLEIQKALDHLTPEQRRVVELRFLQGYDTSEVAAILDKNPSAVRALQARALRALRAGIGAAATLS